MSPVKLVGLTLNDAFLKEKLANNLREAVFL